MLLYAVDWRFKIGKIQGEARTSILNSLSSVLDVLITQYRDMDNLLMPDIDLDEIVAVYFTLDSFQLGLWEEDSLLNLKLPRGMEFHFDNFRSASWISRARLSIPLVEIQGLAVVENEPTGDRKSNRWYEVLNISTACIVRVFGKDPDSVAMRDRQKLFVLSLDRATKRCHYLYHSGTPTSAGPNTCFRPPFALLEVEPTSPVQSFIDLGPLETSANTRHFPFISILFLTF